jgi:glycosyltransferase involved in cell wall biosynthesis
MTPIACGFRQHVIRTNVGETAQCELIQRILADERGQTSRVDRSACEYCFGDGRIQPQRISQVLASAILAANLNLTSAFDARLKELADFAIVEGTSQQTPRGAAAVDVVLPVQRINAATARCIEAWLRQEQTFVVLHLVVIGEEHANDWQGYRDLPNVRIYQWGDLNVGNETATLSNNNAALAFSAAHAITSHLETSFIAIGCVDVLPISTHLILATSEMVERGFEWYAASLQEDSDVVRSSHPDLRTWRRTVQPETAVIQRALWVDLNGIAARSDDADVDFFARAARQKRNVLLSDRIVATSTVKRRQASPADPPEWFRLKDAADIFALHHHGIGFPVDRLSCDVVLPFRGQLHFVEQAIESVLSQSGIDVTLHLIDDATPDDIDSWLRRYLNDARVRVYRNKENIGQFLSFNNVAEFCQSDWIVTQDGDDISLPGRLAETVGIAVMCDADLVGAATTLDGPHGRTRELRHMTTGSDKTLGYHRISYPARPNCSQYFMENPTLVHRRAFFNQVGGFADFGNPLRNRTAVDTEYMLRALHSGANIVSCRRLAIRYRVHAESAIHHEQTRMGSPIRKSAESELLRRLPLFRQGGINPRVFGALGRHRGVTVRWEG